jgi:hypothetical protein
MLCFSVAFGVDVPEIAGTYSLETHIEPDGKPSKCDCRFKGETIRIMADGSFVRENRKGYLSPHYNYESGQCTVTALDARERLVTCCTAKVSAKDLRKAVPFEAVNDVLAEQKAACEEYVFRIRSLRRRDAAAWFSRWPEPKPAQGK